MYVIDRATGEVISAEAFAYQNTSDGVDLKTGRIHYVLEDHRLQNGERYLSRSAGQQRLAAFRVFAAGPAIYVPHNNLCMEFQGVQANYIAGTPYVGANVRMYAGPGGYRASSARGIRCRQRMSGR